MNKLDKKINTVLWLSITSSVLMVAGIPGIVFGAINSWWWLLALSVACVVIGFYGTPLLWVHFGSLKSYMYVLRLIEEQHYYSVREISLQYKLSEKQTTEKINWLIRNFYLTDYFFDGQKLTLNTREKQTKKPYSFKCSNCGGTITTTETFGKCEYCGFVYNKDEKK